MIILGIESTAHTFGIGIVKNGKIIANVRDMYTTATGGIIPIESARHHLNKKHEVYFEALNEAGIKEKDIDVIAFSQGPGLAPCLIEGMKFAKELSIKLKRPVVPVNHCIAHLEVGRITKTERTPKVSSHTPSFKKVVTPDDPVMLYVSGANTQIIAYASGKYRVFGETLDLGVGNFIDTFARFAGIGFPGGPMIQKLAEKGKNYIELPYKVKGMDVALSGIQTKLKQLLESRKHKLEDLAFSLQECVFAMLVETAERALAHTGKTELLLGGGVACNTRLQEMCRIMCRERKAKFFCPENSLLVDNGAMIAYLGQIMFEKGIKFSHKELRKVDIHSRERTDDVEVNWK